MPVNAVQPTPESLFQSYFGTVGPEAVEITFSRPVSGAQIVDDLMNACKQEVGNESAQQALGLYYGRFAIVHGKAGLSPVLLSYQDDVPGGSFAIIPSRESPLIAPDKMYDSLTLIAVSPPAGNDWESCASMPRSSDSKLRALKFYGEKLDKKFSA